MHTKTAQINLATLVISGATQMASY